MRNDVQEALGISMGEVVWTSYGQPRDYEVTAIAAPQLFYRGSHVVIYSAPVISLVCRDLKRESRSSSYLNNIRQVGSR